MIFLRQAGQKFETYKEVGPKLVIEGNGAGGLMDFTAMSVDDDSATALATTSINYRPMKDYYDWFNVDQLA
jgi:hypothetical protein